MCDKWPQIYSLLRILTHVRIKLMNLL